MLRVKLLKPTKYGSVGNVVVIDRNEAFGLIDSGQAILTKDMVEIEYKSKSDEEVKQADGKLSMRPVRKKL